VLPWRLDANRDCAGGWFIVLPRHQARPIKVRNKAFAACTLYRILGI
jgi:hypothetical protein